MNRFTASAEDADIACLQAEHGGIAGYIGPGFVNDADDPDGDTDFPELQTILLRPLPEDAAHGIGQRGGCADTPGHGYQALLIQPETIQHRPGESVVFSSFEILGIGFQYRGALRQQLVGHGAQGGVLGFGRSSGQHTRGGTRGASDFMNSFCQVISHGKSL